MRPYSRRLAAWRSDERGAAAMELLVSLPLLVGMMLITANYGLLLNSREALDSATRDAARILMRAPAGCQTVSGQQVPDPYPHFEALAQQTIADRMGVDLLDVNLATSAFFVPGSEALAGNSYYQVVVQVSVQMDRFALLETFIGDTVLTAAETGRYFSGLAPCTEGCLIADRDAGLCL